MKKNSTIFFSYKITSWFSKFPKIFFGENFKIFFRPKNFNIFRWDFFLTTSTLQGGHEKQGFNPINQCFGTAKPSGLFFHLICHFPSLYWLYLVDPLCNPDWPWRRMRLPQFEKPNLWGTFFRQPFRTGVPEIKTTTPPFWVSLNLCNLCCHEHWRPAENASLTSTEKSYCFFLSKTTFFWNLYFFSNLIKIGFQDEWYHFQRSEG